MRDLTGVLCDEPVGCEERFSALEPPFASLAAAPDR
jgi:hypothetical protein